MRRTHYSSRTRAAFAAGFLFAGLSLPLSAQTFLIDFGNDGSFRGASVESPDINSNYWNSVNSTQYWANLVDINGATTTVGFGFGTATNGNDSYNGPAGTNQDPDLVEIDAAALGDLGINEAVYDFFASATFTIQGLDPSKTYTITFFGSRKFGANTTTVYTVYTSNDYVTAVDSANLDVFEPGAPWLHNSNRVAVIENVAPQFADSLWIGYTGDFGGNGYLNALKIEEYNPVTPPSEIGFTGIGVGGGAAFPSFIGENGVDYTLQYTVDLLAPAGWQDVMNGGNPVTGVGNGVDLLTLYDPSPVDNLRVYRLVETP